MSISRKLSQICFAPALFRIAALFLAIGVFALSNSAPAAAHTSGMILMDADSGEVLHAINADVPNHPASLTKMMTLYLLFDQIEKGRVHYIDRMPVSAHAARQSPSKLGLTPGKTLTVETAVLALVTKSANDAAVVIAEFLGGSESGFAVMMTKKAHDLGMAHTVFRNASGLPINGQWSTPRDMAILARALIRNHASEYHYFSTREFDYGGETIVTHNHLLANYPGADGIKTGYIASAGFNLVASARRNGHRLIGVVFGGNSVHARDRQMVSLLDAGFAHINGAPQIETAKIDTQDDDQAGPAPASEAEAEDPQVAAVMKSMASSQPAAPAAAEPEAAGDADNPPWGIRLGAFGRKDKAEQVVVAASKRLGDIVADGQIQISPTQMRRSTVYRAEIIGLAQGDAIKACSVLRRHHSACGVIKTDDETAAR